MSVYVDTLVGEERTGRWRFKTSCHMYADNLEELHDMAEKLGLRLTWFQQNAEQDRWYDHYDLVSTKRRMAVSLGAIEHTFSQRAKWAENMKQHEGRYIE